MSAHSVSILGMVPTTVSQALPLSKAQRRTALEAYYRSIIQPLTDLEAFARLSEMAAAFAGEDTRQYLDDLSAIIMGLQDHLLSIPLGPLGRWSHKIFVRRGLLFFYPAVLRFGSTGFSFNDHGNQVQHFWFSLLVAYTFGSTLADLAARYHEWNAPGLWNHLPGTAHGGGTLGDVQLSRQAIQVGRALARGAMRPAQIASWLRENL